MSSDGGILPTWSRDGRELFYVNGEKIMAAPIAAGPTFRLAGSPRLLFEYSAPADGGGGFAYDVSPDGRFLMIQSVEPEQPVTQIYVVVSWFEELKRLAPARN